MGSSEMRVSRAKSLLARPLALENSGAFLAGKGMSSSNALMLKGK